MKKDRMCPANDAQVMESVGCEVVEFAILVLEVME